MISVYSANEVGLKDLSLVYYEMKPFDYAAIFKKNLWCKYETISCTPTFNHPKMVHEMLIFPHVKKKWEGEMRIVSFNYQNIFVDSEAHIYDK